MSDLAKSLCCIFVHVFFRYAILYDFCEYDLERKLESTFMQESFKLLYLFLPCFDFFFADGRFLFDYWLSLSSLLFYMPSLCKIILSKLICPLKFTISFSNLVHCSVLFCYISLFIIRQPAWRISYWITHVYFMLVHETKHFLYELIFLLFG